MEIQKIKFLKVLTKDEGVSKRNEPWVSVTFLTETEEQYPKHIMFKVFNKQKLIDFLFGLSENECITVRYDIDAREYNGKWYNDVNCWDCFRAVADTSMQNSTITPKKEVSAANQTKQAPLPSLEQQHAGPAVNPDTQEQESDALPF